MGEKELLLINLSEIYPTLHLIFSKIKRELMDHTEFMVLALPTLWS